MNPHFAVRAGVRTFVHHGPQSSPRLLDLEAPGSEELRLVLPLASNVAAGIIQALAGRSYGSAVGRITTGGASQLHYYRMVTTNRFDRPYDYGEPITLDGYITFISGAITIGKDASDRPLLHCHAGFLDREGKHHGGHLHLDKVIVGSEPLVISLCLFEHIAYRVQPDQETQFNLLHPVPQEVL